MRRRRAWGSRITGDSGAAGHFQEVFWRFLQRGSAPGAARANSTGGLRASVARPSAGNGQWQSRRLLSQQVATSGGPRSSSGKWRQVQDVTCTCSDLGQSWDAKNASFAAYARPRTAAATFAGKFAGLDSSGRASRSKIVRSGRTSDLASLKIIVVLYLFQFIILMLQEPLASTRALGRR